MLPTPFAIRFVRWAFCLLIVASIIAGLLVSGSPATQRRYALDQQRLNQLSQIHYGLEQYARLHEGTLPTNINDLIQEQPHLNQTILDPATAIPFAYRPLTTTSTYEICATFDLPTSPEDTYSAPYPVVQGDSSSLLRLGHTAGNTCYTLTIFLPSSVTKPTITPQALPPAL